MIQTDFIGKELLKILEKGGSIVQISRWASDLFSANCRELDENLVKVLECLLRMEDDPQFELSREELYSLAHKLIDGSEDPFKKD